MGRKKGKRLTTSSASRSDTINQSKTNQKRDRKRKASSTSTNNISKVQRLYSGFKQLSDENINRSTTSAGNLDQPSNIQADNMSKALNKSEKIQCDNCFDFIEEKESHTCPEVIFVKFCNSNQNLDKFSKSDQTEYVDIMNVSSDKLNSSQSLQDDFDLGSAVFTEKSTNTEYRLPLEDVLSELDSPPETKTQSEPNQVQSVPRIRRPRGRPIKNRAGTKGTTVTRRALRERYPRIVSQKVSRKVTRGKENQQNSSNSTNTHPTSNITVKPCFVKLYNIKNILVAGNSVIVSQLVESPTVSFKPTTPISDLQSSSNNIRRRSSRIVSPSTPSSTIRHPKTAVGSPTSKKLTDSSTTSFNTKKRGRKKKAEEPLVSLRVTKETSPEENVNPEHIFVDVIIKNKVAVESSSSDDEQKPSTSSAATTSGLSAPIPGPSTAALESVPSTSGTTSVTTPMTRIPYRAFNQLLNFIENHTNFKKNRARKGNSDKNKPEHKDKIPEEFNKTIEYVYFCQEDYLTFESFDDLKIHCKEIHKRDYKSVAYKCIYGRNQPPSRKVNLSLENLSKENN